MKSTREGWDKINVSDLFGFVLSAKLKAVKNNIERWVLRNKDSLVITDLDRQLENLDILAFGGD